ncbi:NAD(P)/FAD-dependent oxidoreductase [Streptomyces iranensis]|uniref:NAD(P)/FAD-dependent oxidoreductase n=1 Tax=Streptomyces iranensis TaxID=576784 RepID=UPI0039B743A3
MSTVPGMVVVGGGECGARAAFALREAGWNGPLTLVGAEAVPPYERPPLSKSMMTGPHASAPATICDTEILRNAGIDFIAGTTATDIDRDNHEVVLAHGRRIAYRRLLVATGATARPLPIPGAAADGVRYLRSHSDALALRDRLRPGARIGVIGGGFIGLELAASATMRGCAVTVVELAPRLMSRGTTPQIAAVVAARHERAGVDVRCGTGVARLERRDGATLLELTTGETLLCDTVVAGIGAVPETTLAQKAGLAVDNGVRVDTRLTTSDPDVFAAGDCCSWPHPLYGDRRIRLESWRNAQDQGGAAARNMLGADEPFATVPWFWSDQYDLTLHIAGLPDAATTEVVRRRHDGVEIRFGLGPDGRLLTASAIGTEGAAAQDIRLAELLIARRATPHSTTLADPTVSLKALLRQGPR